MTEEQIPLGKRRRGFLAGKAAMGLGARELGFQMRQVILGERPDRAAHEERQAKALFGALSQLRGTALKAAQLLAQDFDFLPEAYRKELSQAAYRVPALNRALVRKLFVKEMGAAPEVLFDTFEPEAFAAASLGQVHQATKDGHQLAVKIQYPGIAHAVEDDLKLMRGVLSPLPNGKLLLQGLEEIEERLREEVDYRLEAERTQWFAKNIQHPDLVVPEVFPQWSSGRILVTERLEGLHLDRWLETDPSQHERDAMGQLMFDLFEFSLHQHLKLHADPNPGNYLFLPDGRLALLDFGCVKEVPLGFPDLINRMIAATIENDQAKLRKIYDQLGFGYATNTEANQMLERWMAWFALPYQVDRFDAGAHQGYIAEGARLFQQHQPHVQSLNRDLLFLDRNWLGLFKMVEQMGAVVNFKFQRTLCFET